jgi:nesprin-1
LLADWLNEVEQKVQSDEGTFLNDLSEKRATLEKFRTLQRDISSHSEMVDRVKNRIADDPSLSVEDYQGSFNKYQTLKDLVAKNIAVSTSVYCILSLHFLHGLFHCKACPIMA